MKRTIICLATKRSGTTALHRLFSAHPEAGICYPDQSVANWEPHFWNFAAAALKDDYSQLVGKSEGRGLTPHQQFSERMKEILPDAIIPDCLTEKAVFELWDAVIECYGPVVFDKTPNYLGSKDGLELLLKYRNNGNDVRIFGLVRDPRDVISSQNALWKELAPNRHPEVCERAWVKAYQHFEWVREQVGDANCPLFRYEEFSANPEKWAPELLVYCGLSVLVHSYAHVRPVSVGRFFIDGDNEIQRWNPGPEMGDIATGYGYDFDQAPGKLWRAKAAFKELLRNPIKRSKRLVSGMAKGGVEMLVFPITSRLPGTGYEQLQMAMIKHRVSLLSEREAAKFLLRIDNQLGELQQNAIKKLGLPAHALHHHAEYLRFLSSKIGRGERVLDIGCGEGVLTRDMAECSGAQAIGADLKILGRDQTREAPLHPNVDYFQGDVLHDFPEQTFDVIVLSNVLEFLSASGRFLLRAIEAARPKRFLIRAHLIDLDWRVPLKKGMQVEWRLDPNHKTEYTLESFYNEMKQAGLKVTHQEVRWGEIWAEAKPTPKVRGRTRE